MAKAIYINGAYYAEADAKISVFDHGLLYGDGVFEGIRVYHAAVFKLYEHVDRLTDSARSILLPLPLDRDGLATAVLDTVARNNLTDGYVRMILTRGIGTLGLNPFICKNGSLIIIADTITLYPPEFYKRGLDIMTVATRRAPTDVLSPQVKSLNYLNNVLAQAEAISAGMGEAVMLNHEGYVAECAGDNIFVVKRGVLFTPAVHSGILDGITRRAVLDLARARGIMVQETELTRHDLYSADECFMTGTAAEIAPVRSIDKRELPGAIPGPLTQLLMNDFQALVARDGVAVNAPRKKADPA